MHEYKLFSFSLLYVKIYCKCERNASFLLRVYASVEMNWFMSDIVN